MSIFNRKKELKGKEELVERTTFWSTSPVRKDKARNDGYYANYGSNGNNGNNGKPRKSWDETKNQPKTNISPVKSKKDKKDKKGNGAKASSLSSSSSSAIHHNEKGKDPTTSTTTSTTSRSTTSSTTSTTTSTSTNTSTSSVFPPSTGSSSSRSSSNPTTETSESGSGNSRTMPAPPQQPTIFGNCDDQRNTMMANMPFFPPPVPGLSSLMPHRSSSQTGHNNYPMTNAMMRESVQTQLWATSHGFQQHAFKVYSDQFSSIRQTVNRNQNRNERVETKVDMALETLEEMDENAKQHAQEDRIWKDRMERKIDRIMNMLGNLQVGTSTAGDGQLQQIQNGELMSQDEELMDVQTEANSERMVNRTPPCQIATEPYVVELDEDFDEDIEDEQDLEYPVPTQIRAPSSSSLTNGSFCNQSSPFPISQPEYTLSDSSSHSSPPSSYDSYSMRPKKRLPVKRFISTPYPVLGSGNSLPVKRRILNSPSSSSSNEDENTRPTKRPKTVTNTLVEHDYDSDFKEDWRSSRRNYSNHQQEDQSLSTCTTLSTSTTLPTSTTLIVSNGKCPVQPPKLIHLSSSDDSPPPASPSTPPTPSIQATQFIPLNYNPPSAEDPSHRHFHRPSNSIQARSKYYSSPFAQMNNGLPPLTSEDSENEITWENIKIPLGQFALPRENILKLKPVDGDRCRLCEKRFGTEMKTLAHAIEYHGLPFKCTICFKKTFTKEFAYKRHTETCQGYNGAKGATSVRGLPLTCSTCLMKTFTNEIAYKKHVEKCQGYIPKSKRPKRVR